MQLYKHGSLNVGYLSCAFIGKGPCCQPGCFVNSMVDPDGAHSGCEMCGGLMHGICGEPYTDEEGVIHEMRRVCTPCITGTRPHGTSY